MNDKTKMYLDKLRQLVSDVQGAPYPSDDFQPELYKIWYEHVQKSATDVLEFLGDNYPEKENDFSELLENLR